MQIDQIATKTHVSISSFMNRERPQINHQYVWHLSKWVVKKLTRKAQHLLKCHNWDIVYQCKDVNGKLDLLSTIIKAMFDISASV